MPPKTAHNVTIETVIANLEGAQAQMKLALV
jgi:hypothetical protein